MNKENIKYLSLSVSLVLICFNLLTIYYFMENPQIKEVEKIVYLTEYVQLENNNFEDLEITPLNSNQEYNQLVDEYNTLLDDKNQAVSNYKQLKEKSAELYNYCVNLENQNQKEEVFLKIIELII